MARPQPPPFAALAGLTIEQVFVYGRTVADLPIPELVENQRRSVAMLPAGASALNRDEALELLRQLGEALRELRRRNSDWGRRRGRKTTAGGSEAGIRRNLGYPVGR
jgi:hypothetical protein